MEGNQESTLDALQYAMQIGRLDFVSILLACIGIFMVFGGIFAFLNIKRNAQSVARKAATETAERVARKAATETAERVAREAATETAERVARKAATETATETAESMAKQYLQDNLPKILEESGAYNEFIKRQVNESVANKIAKAQEDEQIDNN